MRRLGVLAALAATALLAGGCGGDDPASTDGIDRIPADAPLVALVDTDFEGDQWQTADALIERFPGGRGGIRGLLGMHEGVDFERDVEPALGAETVIAALDAEGKSTVVLTEPDDPARFEALAARAETRAVTRELNDGWWAAADSEATLDRLDAASEGPSLGESDAWESATNDLPDDALLVVYSGTGPVDQGLRGAPLPREAADALRCLVGGEDASPGALAVTAEDDGLRVTGSMELPEALPEPEKGASELAGVLAGDAVAVISARSLEEYLREALRCATQESNELATQLAQIELALGLSFEEDLLPLLAQETAVAVYERRGATPAVVAATRVDDEARALAVVDRVVERSRLLEASVAVEEATIGGIEARRVRVGGEQLLVYGAAGGVLGFSNADAGLLAIGGGAPALADEAEYRAARDAAGAPEEDAGFLYVDGQRAASFVASSLAPAGLPLDFVANLEPLRSLLLWGTVDDDRSKFEGLVRID